MKVVFFGTPDFAADTLSYLVSQGIEICAVVTRPDRPKGRSGTPQPSSVKSRAVELLPNIPIYSPEKASTPEFVELLSSFHADLFIVAAYGEIVRQNLLNLPRLGCINLHASLLPKYRGAAPIQQAIIDGEIESGATIMHMVLKMDAGNIIKMVHVPITAEMTAGELEELICSQGSVALVEVIKDFAIHGRQEGIPQDESQVTMAPKIELEQCEINWQQPAAILHNLIRGVNPQPGAWCFVLWRGEKKRLKIFRSKVALLQGTPGSILAADKEGILVACGIDALHLQEIQLEGKKRMPAAELLRGVQSHEIQSILSFSV